MTDPVLPPPSRVSAPVPPPLSDDELDREILEFLGKKSPRRTRPLIRFALLPIKIFVLAVLPFWVLIRGSVFAYYQWQLGGWPSLGVGAIATTLLLTLYGAVISKKLTGKLRLKAVGTRVVLPVVAAFCAYSLIYLSSSNAKTPEVGDYYRSVHPLLRIASSTVILVDRDAMITGLGRVPEDYSAMGLTPRESSLHYVQSSGFVHALDLRTVGRGEVRNGLINAYFRAMGFRTLRHVGTADHLHVSLPIP